MIQQELLAILNTYSSKGYFTYGNIPGNKLQAAVQHYPVDLNDTPLALIDSTVFGSAKNGMVIGLKGLYWRNFITNDNSGRNFVSWEELADPQAPMTRSTFSVQLAPGCEFDMSGSPMGKQLLINLLNQLVALYRNYRDGAYRGLVTQEDVAEAEGELIESGPSCKISSLIDDGSRGRVGGGVAAPLPPQSRTSPH